MPLNMNEVCTVLNECPTGASTIDHCITVQAEGALLSLFVQELTGTLDVNVYTLTKTGEEKLIDTFPQISAPTAELVIRKQVEVHDQLRVEVITSDAAKYDIRAKGVSAGLASVNVQGAGDWSVTNITAADSGSAPTLLIPSSLVGRNGLDIRNANFNTADILQVADTEAKIIAGVYRSVLPGEAFQPSLDAGNAVWARSSTGNTIRVEITEVGTA